MTTNRDDLLREEIFSVLNCYEIDASEVNDGKTYIDSGEAENLTREILALTAQQRTLASLDGRIEENQILWPRFTDIQFDGTNGIGDNPAVRKVIEDRRVELEAQRAKLIGGDK